MTTDKVVELLIEYADCRDDLDVYKVAAGIREVVLSEHKEQLGRLAFPLEEEDKEIADNMRDYWRHQQSGAE